MRRPALLLLSLLSAPATFAADGTISASFDVEVKGVRVMKLRYAAQLTDKAYTANLVAKTTGMAKWFSEYKIEYSSQGTISKGKYITTNFTREKKKNGKKSGTGVPWSNGVPQIDADDVDGGARVQKTVANGATDPMALLLNLGFSQSENPCAGKHIVFDGRDVMDTSLAGKSVGEGTVTCKIAARTVAGRTYERANDKSNILDVYTVTFKQIDAPFLGRSIYMPLQITGQASGQEFVATAGDVEVTGTPSN
jgi:Protein of unknown function (DUF3108)